MARLAWSHQVGVLRWPWTWKGTVVIAVALFSLMVLSVHCRSLPQQTKLVQSKQHPTQLLSDRVLVRNPRKASRGSRGKGGKRKQKKQKQNQKQQQQQNPICQGGHFQIAGALNLPEVFALVAYDTKKSQHLMYFIPQRVLSIYISTGTIALDGALIASMQSILGFDPAVESQRIISNVGSLDPITRPELNDQKQQAIKSNPEGEQEDSDNRNNSRLILLYYDPKKSAEVDAIELRQGSEEPRHETIRPEGYDRKEVQIVDSEKKGFVLFQCGDPTGSNWCTADFYWSNGKAWFNPAQGYFVLGESPGPAGSVMLVWMKGDAEFPDGVTPVTWKNVNGFISRESNSVVLFADDHVYQYEDLFGSNRYLFAMDGNISFTCLKVPVEQYFSCDGQLFIERIRTPAPGESKAGRAKFIYGLFAAHFVVAAFMILIIAVFTLTADNDFSAHSSCKKAPMKRVRKAKRSALPDERSKSFKSTSKSASTQSKQKKEQTKSVSRSTKCVSAKG